MDKKSFVIHIDSLDVIDSMSGDQTKELLLAFRDYHIGKEIKLNGLMNAVFTQFKNQFDRDLEKYKKTVERNKGNGSKGGRPPKTQNNPNKPNGLNENPIKPKKADNDSVSDNGIINKDIFIEIKNFKSYHSNFSGNKKYLLIAYRFWELWKKDNPQNLTIKKARVLSWVNTIRLIVEVDEQNIERLICILKYFEKCQEENVEYDNFWFKTIKSIGGLRETNKQGVYRLDSIMDIVNTKIQKDDAFNRLVTDSIENFKNYNHERN